MLDELRFHHAGIACRDIAREEQTFASLGYVREGNEFVDPVQGVRGMFLTGQQPRLELLQPISELPGVLSPWLKGPAKIYHVGFEVPRLDESIARLRSEGAKLVVNPVPAVAFNGRLIAFLMLPNRFLVELIASV